MELFLNQWGNSLGLRLPKHIVNKMGLTKGSKLVIEDTESGILLKKPNKLTLENIIESYPENYISEEEIFRGEEKTEGWEWESNPE